MAFRPVPCRLARFLLAGADKAGMVRCTQEEIASSISASRVTVSRTLNQLARDGLVELQYRGVLVRDRPVWSACARRDGRTWCMSIFLLVPFCPDRRAKQAEISRSPLTFLPRRHKIGFE